MRYEVALDADLEPFVEQLRRLTQPTISTTWYAGRFPMAK
jgi:hypothetical protein